MATATHTFVSLDTYLHTAYRPDCDWVEGELRERHVGQFEHSNFQAELIAFFRNRRDAWKVRALPEQRIQVAATRFRVPDIVVILLDDERPPVLKVAPLICIEIMSPDDTAGELQDRCLEYLQMGVRCVWVFDPVRRRAWDVTESGWRSVTGEAILAVGEIRLIPKELFELNSR